MCQKETFCLKVCLEMLLFSILARSNSACSTGFILHGIVLYSIVLHCISLYCIVLHDIVQYYTVLFSFRQLGNAFIFYIGSKQLCSAGLILDSRRLDLTSPLIHRWGWTWWGWWGWTWWWGWWWGWWWSQGGSFGQTTSEPNLRLTGRTQGNCWKTAEQQPIWHSRQSIL